MMLFLYYLALAVCIMCSVGWMNASDNRLYTRSKWVLRVWRVTTLFVGSLTLFLFILLALSRSAETMFSIFGLSWVGGLGFLGFCAAASKLWSNS